MSSCRALSLGLVLVAGACGAPSAQAPAPVADPVPPVNAAALDAHLRYLSDDLLEGRAPGTRGGELAARYIAAQFQALGLEGAGADGSYFQPVALRPSFSPQPFTPTPGSGIQIILTFRSNHPNFDGRRMYHGCVTTCNRSRSASGQTRAPV